MIGVSNNKMCKKLKIINLILIKLITYIKRLLK